MTKIRILVVEPDKAPRVEHVLPDDWDTWYPLVDKTTHLLQSLRLRPRIEMLFDEEGIRKNMPINVYVPAHAPAAFDGDFVVDATNGEGMQPGQPGIGYHKILGTFIVARTRGAEYVDLKDEDIADVERALGSRGKRINAELVTVGPLLTHEEAQHAREEIRRLRGDDDDTGDKPS